MAAKPLVTESIWRKIDKPALLYILSTSLYKTLDGSGLSNSDLMIYQVCYQAIRKILDTTVDNSLTSIVSQVFRYRAALKGHSFSASQTSLLPSMRGISDAEAANDVSLFLLLASKYVSGDYKDIETINLNVKCNLSYPSQPLPVITNFTDALEVYLAKKDKVPEFDSKSFTEEKKYSNQEDLERYISICNEAVNQHIKDPDYIALLAMTEVFNYVYHPTTATKEALITKTNSIVPDYKLRGRDALVKVVVDTYGFEGFIAAFAGDAGDAASVNSYTIVMKNNNILQAPTRDVQFSAIIRSYDIPSGNPQIAIRALLTQQGFDAALAGAQAFVWCLRALISRYSRFVVEGNRFSNINLNHFFTPLAYEWWQFDYSFGTHHFQDKRFMHANVIELLETFADNQPFAVLEQDDVKDKVLEDLTELIDFPEDYWAIPRVRLALQRSLGPKWSQYFKNRLLAETAKALPVNKVTVLLVTIDEIQKDYYSTLAQTAETGIFYFGPDWTRDPTYASVWTSLERLYLDNKYTPAAAGALILKFIHPAGITIKNYKGLVPLNEVTGPYYVWWMSGRYHTLADQIDGVVDFEWREQSKFHRDIKQACADPMMLDMDLQIFLHPKLDIENYKTKRLMDLPGTKLEVLNATRIAARLEIADFSIEKIEDEKSWDPDQYQSQGYAFDLSTMTDAISPIAPYQAELIQHNYPSADIKTILRWPFWSDESKEVINYNDLIIKVLGPDYKTYYRHLIPELETMLEVAARLHTSGPDFMNVLVTLKRLVSGWFFQKGAMYQRKPMAEVYFFSTIAGAKVKDQTQLVITDLPPPPNFRAVLGSKFDTVADESLKGISTTWYGVLYIVHRIPVYPVVLYDAQPVRFIDLGATVYDYVDYKETADDILLNWSSRWPSLDNDFKSIAGAKMKSSAKHEAIFNSLMAVVNNEYTSNSLVAEKLKIKWKQYVTSILGLRWLTDYPYREGLNLLIEILSKYGVKVAPNMLEINQVTSKASHTLDVGESQVIDQVEPTLPTIKLKSVFGL